MNLEKEAGQLARDLVSLSGKHSGEIQTLCVVSIEHLLTDGYLLAIMGSSPLRVLCRTNDVILVGDYVFARPIGPDQTTDWVYAGFCKQSDGTPQARGGGIATANFVIDGGGSAITIGEKGFLSVGFAGYIERAAIVASLPGSINIEVRKSSYNDFSLGLNVIGTIVLTSAQKMEDWDLSTWTTRSVALNDVFLFSVLSADTMTYCTVALDIRRS